MGARPAVAVIDSLAAEGRQQEFFRSRTPPSLSGAARALSVHHLAQNGAALAHHIISALSVGRTNADDFDEVFDYYFNKLTQTSCFVTPLGRRVKFTGHAELTAPAVGSGCWSK